MTQTINLQTALKKALRFIDHNEMDILRSDDLHLKYNITPLNISKHKKACKIWETVLAMEQEHYDNLIDQHGNNYGREWLSG